MAQVLQLRRGTTAQNDAFTGAVAEVSVDTDRDSLRVHDGTTMGGKEIAPLNVAIPLLADATTVNAADELIIQQGGITKRATGAELAKGLNNINGLVNVRDFGAVGDGVADDTAAINAALLSASQSLNRTVFLAGGSYRVTSTIVFPNVSGLCLLGAGKASAGGLESNGISRIIADHTSGPALRSRNENCVLRYIQIDSSSTRTASTSSSLHGVLIEPEDEANAGARSCLLDGVSVRNQSGSAFVTSGNCNHTSFSSSTARNCKGHGFVLDNGTITSRVNTERAGQISIVDCRAFNVSGHGIMCGNLGASYGAYRILVSNFESQAYTTEFNDATIRRYASNSWFHGENIVIVGSAFAGSVNGSASLSGLYVSGRSNRVVACRYITVASPAIRIGNDASNANSTMGITVDGMVVSQDVTVNPAVSIETGATGIVFFNTSSDRISVAASGDTSDCLIVNNTGSVTTTKVFVPSATGIAPLEVERDGAEVGLTITRTGSGATTGRVACVGGTLTLQTTTDNNTVIGRNGSARITVKSSTINIPSLPTSDSGLVSGDLWNDSGTVKIKT